MLLEFSAGNYKSFRDPFVLSMIPAPKQKGLDYSILSEQIGKKKYRALSSAVLYGPNASGKSNIVSAMETFRMILLRGNIHNSDERQNPNVASNLLELIPNIFLEKPEPVRFGIKCFTDGLLIEFAITLDIGCFTQTDYPRKILEESLRINEEEIYSRDKGLNVGSLHSIETFLLDSFEANKEVALALAKGSLNPEELFLTNGFKTIVSSKLVELIRSWFDTKFMIVYRADALTVERTYPGTQVQRIHREESLSKAMNEFGLDSHDIGFLQESGKDDTRLCSLLTSLHNQESLAVPIEYFESHGSIRFAHLFQLISIALREGSVLVVDEFDASIHPMAIMNIINIFHNDEININKAQLIFNTHNPIYLDANLFRRDEIKFVEYDDENHTSSIYSLSDFGTSGVSGVRKGNDYMKHYFLDRYGAIRDLDFSYIFEESIGKE
ncbi:MAG: ATP-binding protein [Clostridiaceae bacterium]|nr:ATP-binding protein [Clostridiaceae bacterium]